MKKKLLLFMLLVFSVQVTAQPYFDLLSISGWCNPSDGNTTEWYNQNSVSLPLKLKHGKMFAFSPAFEERKIQKDNESDALTMLGASLPVSFIQFYNDSNWTLNTTAIVRSNSDEMNLDNNSFQVAGVVLNTWKIKPGLKLKAGAYYSREFFGDFFLLLAGIDWKINERWNLFGVLPGNMRIEYRINDKLYAGSSFKSITNSYRISDSEKGYIKVTDNHITAFMDVQLANKLVFSLDAGYTFFRDIETRNLLLNNKFKKDGPIIKAGLFYRIRF